MNRIDKHPIIKIDPVTETQFNYNGKTITGQKGFTIAAALHQAGYPIHSHSIKHRSRSLECGIGKCGACEMLVDGLRKRICLTLCDDVKEVRQLPADFVPAEMEHKRPQKIKIYKTSVVIIGAGPAGLAARQKLNDFGIRNIVVDSNSKTGGQFLMQTHQFFFFEEEQRFGGMRGHEIAGELAGGNDDGIMLDSTVWDILEGKRIAVKNFKHAEVFYIDCDYLIVAAGAVPSVPPFGNDDLPGIYTAAVVQKMMNTELTLLGRNVLTVGAGNIGYLTSYQLMQAGVNVKAIIELMPNEGGFPVQANRIRRLGVPILLSKKIIEAIPGKDGTGISGAVLADCKNGSVIPGTEAVINGIDMINICTGLVPDSQLLTKGREIFGVCCLGAGDAVRISEGTSAVLRGMQAAYDIAELQGIGTDYGEYLNLSKKYLDSQQRPLKVIDAPALPDVDRRNKPFVIIDCLYGFACNPCAFACPHGAITKSSSSTVPRIDYGKCSGCMKCVTKCPGLAIFGYDIKGRKVFLPVEFDCEKDDPVFLVDNDGKIIGKGLIDRVTQNRNLTSLVRVRAEDISGEELISVRGFIGKDDYPAEIDLKKTEYNTAVTTYTCHCDDVTLDEVLAVIGSRKFVSVDEIKHTTRLGMGACRGKRCIPRLKRQLAPLGINLVGNATPRAPLSNQVRIGEVAPALEHDVIVTPEIAERPKAIRVQSFIAGGGIGGSSLFRYLAEAGLEPVLINHGTGASWRNIAGGRPVFSLPELSDIAVHNLEIFKELQSFKNIDYREIFYITFAHDQAMFDVLEESMSWQKGEMIYPDKFRDAISPYFNTENNKYIAALKTGNCWHASPGKTIDLIRHLGIEAGGTIYEDCELIDLQKDNGLYTITVKRHNGVYEVYETGVFINALGPAGGKFALCAGIDTGIYSIKHQAFITGRLPMLGASNGTLPMLIDRRPYKGFSAVYGHQMAETGQIIGCASPLIEPNESGKELKINSREFLEIISETFIDWIPRLSSVGFQAAWSGYYVEPKMIIDPDAGLFIGLKGQGFMLGQYLARLYVDKLTGKEVPAYFKRLALGGDGLIEKAFK